MRQLNLRRAVLALALAGAGAMAPAQVFLFLNDQTQAALPGQVLTFTGRIENTGAGTVFLNGEGFTLAMPQVWSWQGLSLESNFANVPEQLAGGAIWSGTLFTVTVASAAPQLTEHVGTYALSGGPNGTSQNLLDSANFQVQVVPEPATLAALGVGLLALRKRRLR